jgi:hypothetical protein
MRPLTASQLIEVWERGLHRTAVEQALLPLAVACPEKSWDELLQLSLGRRDLDLLELRAQTLGPAIQGLVACPHCGEQLEFTLDTPELLRASVPELPVAPGNTALEFICEGFQVSYRLPNSEDLDAARSSSEARRQDVLGVKMLLAQRCLVTATGPEGRVAANDLPGLAVEQLAARLAESETAAEILLDLKCSGCGRASPIGFDIASFFWSEISALAKRLLREVHVLASAYGWSEREILAMTAVRRQFYLELVG